MLGHGFVDNVVVTADGIYDIYYVKNGRMENHTGKIRSVVQDRCKPDKSYILFDCSNDLSGRKERVYFYQVQNLKDVTPNDAYRIALEHGFQGTVEEWLESLKGAPGDSAYDLAVKAGFKGTEEEWLESLKGETGKSAYELAVEQGFEGTLDDWLVHQGAVEVVDKKVDTVNTEVQTIKTNHLTWILGMDREEVTK